MLLLFIIFFHKYNRNRPIFVISNVTGLNLKLLARYLRVTSIPEKGQRKAALPYGSGSMMMQIEDTYNVPGTLFLSFFSLSFFLCK